MRVLIADDDRIALEMLARQLRELGYDVITASDGLEAWEKYQQSAVSLVITDWLMPNMNGLELLRRIRSSTSPQYVYCILLTVKGHVEDLVKGMDTGADDFLTKPFNPSELRVRVNAGKRIIQLERSLSTTNARMKKELEAAATIQQAWLPVTLPSFLEGRFAWKYQPCDELGGDILNIIPLSDNEVAIYLLDVAGHGLCSALLSVALSRVLTTATNASSMIRDKVDTAEIYRVVEPAEVLSRLNDRFQTAEQFFTMFYGVLDLRTRRLRYASGGHNPALLVGADRSVRMLASTGTVVGIFEDEEFEQQNVDMNQGDRLLVYSDGIVDAVDSENQQFGLDRLIDLAQSGMEQSMQTFVDRLVEAVEQWCHPEGLKDDISCLITEAL